MEKNKYQIINFSIIITLLVLVAFLSNYKKSFFMVLLSGTVLSVLIYTNKRTTLKKHEILNDILDVLLNGSVVFTTFIAILFVYSLIKENTYALTNLYFVASYYLVTTIFIYLFGKYITKKSKDDVYKTNCLSTTIIVSWLISAMVLKGVIFSVEFLVKI